MHGIKGTKLLLQISARDSIWKTKFGIKSKNGSGFVQAADHPILQIQFGLHGNANTASSCV